MKVEIRIRWDGQKMQIEGPNDPFALIALLEMAKDRVLDHSKSAVTRQQPNILVPDIRATVPFPGRKDS